jgi:spore germination cell wall hydrolase CwlJ-like protein
MENMFTLTKKKFFVIVAVVAMLLPGSLDHRVEPPVQTVSVMMSVPKIHIKNTLHAPQTSELDCLARNIYFEARGEPLVGQIAVAAVTINRVRSERFPNTICSVVWQHWQTASGVIICQFSWVCDAGLGKPFGPGWQQSVDLARSILKSGYNSLLEDFPDFEQVKWFHVADLDVRFSRTMTKVAVIGNHVFFKN